MKTQSLKETLSKGYHFPIAFHKEFYKIFGKSLDESHTDTMNSHFNLGEIDSDYLSKLILSGNMSTWKHIAKMKIPLAKNLEKFSEAFDEICNYFTNPDTRASDLKNNFSAITNYITEKFSKSAIYQDTVCTRAQHLSNPQ